MAKLLGPDGKPISSADLAQTVAAPGMMSVRSYNTTYPTHGATPARIAQILRSADHGSLEAYFDLAEEIEEKDAHYLAVMSTRKRAVSQLPVAVTAARKDDAVAQAHVDFVTDWLATGALQESLFDMLDAIGKGFSILEIDWETRPDRVRPRALIYRPQRWFGIGDVDRETILLREGATKQELSPLKFVIHRHKAKSGLTHRGGLARTACWLFMFKAFTMRDWALFVQSYGMPIRIGRYEANTSKADQDVLWQAVSSIAGDAAAIIPKGMDIEFVRSEAAQQNSKLYEERCSWIDQQLSKLILGQTTTTDAVSGGHAVAKEHRLVQEDIERADAISLATTINRQLIVPMIALNFGPQESYPVLHIGRPDEVPLQTLIEGISKLGPQGLTVDMQEVRDRFGVKKPEAGAEVIGGVRTATPALPGEAPAPMASLMSRVQISRHAAEADDALERMTQRLALDAAGAMAGLTETVRHAIEGARDLGDASARLQALQLDPAALALAMTRATAVAHLAGEAAVLDAIAPRRR
jgi:phage gp29-like protein